MELGDHQCMPQLWRLALMILLFMAQARAWAALGGLGGLGGLGSSGDGVVDPASFIFSDFEENLQDLSLIGDAKFVRIEGQARGMAVQLSGTRKNTAGRLLYSLPINLLDSSSRPASFSTAFEFSMSSFAGDGLAFVVVPDKTSIGASGPFLGLIDEGQISNRTARAPNTFAVEFDSVMNTELRDPNSNHVGVDVETILSCVTANASDMLVVLNDGSRNFAWIDYDGAARVLEVRISKSAGEKPREPLLVHGVDLAQVWRPWMYVGFSSSTGDAWQKHKIFSWSFSSTGGDSSNSVLLMSSAGSPDADGPASPSGGEFRFDAAALISLVVGFICGASLIMFLVAGWVLLRRIQNHQRGGEYEELS